MQDSERRDAIIAHPGDTVELRAPGEGVGGYLWHADVPPNVGTVVDESLGVAKPGMGAGRDKVFKVRLKGDGIARLVQSRQWEPAPARVIEYPIECRTSGKP